MASDNCQVCGAMILSGPILLPCYMIKERQQQKVSIEEISCYCIFKYCFRPCERLMYILHFVCAEVIMKKE